MELIYTDKNMKDIGSINKFNMDFDTTNTMDYTLAVDSGNQSILDDGFVYIPGTEYGGIIDKKTPSTITGNTVYYGRNYRGILNSKIVYPATGQDYKYLNGDIYEILTNLISEFNLSSYFILNKESISGYKVSNYKVDRYCSLYSLMVSLAKKFNKNLWLNYDISYKKILITFRSSIDYSKKELYCDAKLDMEVTKSSRLTTHLLCLGSGQLKDRIVADIWLNEDKKTFNTDHQVFFGLDDYTQIYENVNSNSKEDLLSAGISKFEELINVDTISVTLDSEDNLKIGDIIGGYEPITKTSATSTISNIIVNIEDGISSISYETN